MNTLKSEAKFAIKYDGPALANHTMNAKDLGPALLAISSLCQEANRVLTGENANVEVQVTATGEGSFEIGLELVQYATAIAPLLLETGKPTANDILELLGLNTPLSVSGLLGFLKWKKGRPIEKEEPFIDDHGSYIQIWCMEDLKKSGVSG